MELFLGYCWLHWPCFSKRKIFKFKGNCWNKIQADNKRKAWGDLGMIELFYILIVVVVILFFCQNSQKFTPKKCILHFWYRKKKKIKIQPSSLSPENSLDMIKDIWCTSAFLFCLSTQPSNIWLESSGSPV